MSAWWSGIVDWVDEREPVTWLALFRVAVGVIVVGMLLDMVTSGAFELLWGGQRTFGDWRVRALGGPSAEVSGGLMVGALLGGLSVVLGVGSRVGALLAGQCMMALLSLAPGTGGGHDRYILNALWIIVLGPADASLSLTAWWRGQLLDPTPRAAWPRRLAAFQLVVVYFLAGIAKAAPEWWPWGNLEAVYRALLQPSWAKGDLTFVAHIFPLTQAATLVTVLWEIAWVGLLPWWLLRRLHDGKPQGRSIGRAPLRAGLVGLGLAMHGTLWLTSNLGPFPFITVAFYLALFDDRDWRRAARVGVRRLR